MGNCLIDGKIRDLAMFNLVQLLLGHIQYPCSITSSAVASSPVGTGCQAVLADPKIFSGQRRYRGKVPERGARVTYRGI